MISETDVILFFYSLFILMGLPVGYKYASNMIKKTGLVLAHCVIAIFINIVMGLIGTIFWLFYSWGVNEFLFIGGMLLGMGISLVNIIILLLLLYFRRKKFQHKSPSDVSNT
ncbi:hypothetical protein [Alteribacillus bidgolensis]|uniref:Uncharacterized protein n=1 Tax=Alteribacillus bidgolensis TaxID=930129 RepID=A0A1G8QN19_9BACI|nr:hypothetical protein [Alteribacillus bidgolensis]SDJ06107.1 hypothetical protein SAMN05216352_1214 [Alteribacillus bidgolensis]